MCGRNESPGNLGSGLCPGHLTSYMRLGKSSLSLFANL